MKPENKKQKSTEDEVNAGSGQQGAGEDFAQDFSHEEEQASWLEDTRGLIDREFPLSGGETEEDLRSGTDDDENDDDNINEQEHLDDNFPLSGG